MEISVYSSLDARKNKSLYRFRVDCVDCFRLISFLRFQNFCLVLMLLLKDIKGLI